MFYILWEYSVDSQYRKQFEEEYKGNGNWSQLFKKGKGYIETKLLKSNNNQYVLIDIWNTKEDYYSFLSLHKEEYSTKSEVMKSIILRENKIGEYFDVEEI